MENKLILIVDDDPDIRGELGIILTKKGFQPLLASNGEDALSVYREHKPHVVITDFKMPGMSGLDLLKTLKAINKNVMVIMMSGAADIKTTIEIMKADAFDFLPKPIEIAQLLKIIDLSFERAHIIYLKEENITFGSFLTHEKIIHRKEISLLKFLKDLDEHTEKKYHSNFQNILQEEQLNKFVIFDLGAARYINNIGFNLLISFKNTLESKGHKLYTMRLNEFILTYFRNLGYLDYFNVIEGMEEIEY